jgi:two-component system OmpR family response regulator
MDIRPHLLVIDDDHEIRDLLTRFMEKNGFRITAVRDAREARRAWTRGAFQLVVLDLMLPGESGLDLARWLRDQEDVPIVMLSAMGEDTDRIIGLELGADDYIAKPFNPRELMARIRAVMRRATDTQENTSSGERIARPLRFAGWTLEPARRRLLNPESVEVPLTGGEYDLLFALLERANRVAGPVARAAGGPIRPRHRRGGEPPPPQARRPGRRCPADQDRARRRLCPRRDGRASLASRISLSAR